jgi:hypothetical protein
MVTKPLIALAVLVAAVTTPARATSPAAPAEETWRPWANLLQESPYDVPREVARLRGLTPTSRCASPAPSLPVAVARLAAALGVPAAPAGVALAPETAAYVARLVDCIATHVPHLPAYEGGGASDALRSQWLGTMTDLLALVRDVPALPPSDAPAACIDPLCLVQVGGTGSDTYTANAVLIVDQGGSDTYNNNAGGATPAQLRPVALLLDLGTDGDAYEPIESGYSLRPTNGSGGVGGVGVLVDEGGGDHYCGLGLTMGGAVAGGGLLLDLAGDDFYESYDPDDATATDCPWNAGTTVGQSHKVSHGAAFEAGFGFLVDAGGSDHYLNYGVDSLGWGGIAGTGLLVDQGAGTDKYDNRTALTGGCPGANCQEWSGVSIGVGEVQGVGVLLDGGGPDTYGCSGEVVYACIGASSAGLLGLVYDAGGDDTYTIGAVDSDARIAGLGAGEAVAIVAGVSLGSNPPVPGAGIFVDVSGSDTYTSVSPHAAGSGDPGTGGLTVQVGAGVFLDLAGDDTYAVPGAIKDDGLVWTHLLVGIGKDF